MSDEHEGGRFAKLTFEDFRRMATDESLSKYEKIGFPDSYRRGAEESIFEDIVAKLPALEERGLTIIDIGPGCSDLPAMLVELCRRNGHTLVLVDSSEMLAHFEDRPSLRKIAAQFPDAPDLIAEFREAADVVLAYSMLHYVVPELSVTSFLDRALELLAPGGAMLIGDVPNFSKRRRFFSSAAGRRSHREFTGRDEDPTSALDEPAQGQIDDAVVLSLLGRARAAGFDAYVAPQRDDLPMANRREDLIFRRP